MTEPTNQSSGAERDGGSFFSAAPSLARNPLGIVALALVLVYAIAGVAFVTSGDGLNERNPLLWFIVVFPLLVMGVFAWLVATQSSKLYSPRDFKDEKNFLKYAKAGRADGLIAAAEAKGSGEEAGALGQGKPNVRPLDPLSPEIERAVDSQRGPVQLRSILWVDDRPENNVLPRQAFEALDIQVTLALNTEQALAQLNSRSFGVVISDMGRKEGPREGYVLLDAMREKGDQTPLIFFAASNAPEHKAETFAHGGQGCTSSPRELYDLVLRELLRRT